MANHVLLNNVDHMEIRINTARSSVLGDNVMSCMAYHNEFRNLQAYYPIVFSLDPNTGETYPVALTGLVRGENLFLDTGGWSVPYIPAAIEMQPFLIGYSGAAGEAGQTVIHIDMDSPRIGTEGEPVFLPMGGNSPYLEHVIALLARVHEGYRNHQDFAAVLKRYDLLEPFSLDMELADGSSNRLTGYHTINEENLAALDSVALADLNEKGYLQAIYMAVASLSNLADLVHRKNARIEAGVGSDS